MIHDYMVYDLAQERLLIFVRPDGPRLRFGWSAIVQRVFFLVAHLDLAFREGPVGEERFQGVLT
jgi:hypothetical protein